MQLEATQEEIRHKWIAQQRKVDGLVEHRETASRAHAQELMRLAAIEADREWLARMPVAGQISGDGTAA